MMDITSGDHRIPNFEQWATAERVVVTNTFWIDHKNTEIGLLPGQVIKGPFPKGMKPSKTRTVKVPQVMWAKVTGADVLEGPTDSRAGIYIPIVAVTGEGGISARNRTDPA